MPDVGAGRPRASREVERRKVDNSGIPASFYRFLSELAERMRVEPQRAEVGMSLIRRQVMRY